MPISCLSQCHLQVGPLHMKKQVGAIRRKIAKPGPGIHVSVQVIPRLFHRRAWFLAVQCTKEGQSNIQKVPSHVVFLTEFMEEPGEVSSFKDTQGRYLAFIEWEGLVSQPVKARIPSNRRHLEHSLVHVWLMSSTAPSQRSICIWQLSTSWFLHIQNTRSTNTSVSSQSTRTTLFSH